MASGALFSGVCFGSAADAARSAWSGVTPVISAGDPPIVSTVEFTSVWQIVARQNGTVISAVQAPDLAFAECDPASSVLDGLSLGWAVVAVWAAAWAVMALRRGISR